MPKTPRQRSSANAWLLELGVEELPVTAIAAALEQLRTVTPALLTAARLECGPARAFATPRRIGVIVSDVAPRQRADMQELIGPPTSAAFDANDQPTQACLGFLKKWNAGIKDVQIKETPRGPCIMVRRTLPTRSAARALGGVVIALLAKLQFSKTMRWHADADHVFARPVRWIVSLYGSDLMPVRWGPLQAGRTSCVSRSAKSASLRITSAAKYEKLLKDQGIIIDPAVRRQAVQRALERQLKPGERLAPECLVAGTSLLEEVADLVESPAAFRGSCAAKFAELPREILIASMAKYQRVFAVEGKNGKLLPTFIAVTNGAPGDAAAVRRVYEVILAARLSDSLLFYQQDLRTSLKRLVPQTAGILLHRQLGTMEQKTARLLRLTSWLAAQWRVSPEEQCQAASAAELCKADLVSHVVYEFPSLQGIMGGIYHTQQHPNSPSDRVIAEAIQDHYLAHRDVPRSIIGIMLAVADRIDTLTGFLGVGIKPTGSADPFGLRRAANELLSLLMHENAHPLSLRKLIEASIDQWPQQGFSLPSVPLDAVSAYLKERFEARQDARYDLARAVLAAGFDDVGDALARIKALETCVQREPQLFAQACKVSERTRNIVRSNTSTVSDISAAVLTVDSTKLTEPLERELWTAIEAVDPQLRSVVDERRYAEALQLYARTFSDLLERFFTHVLVNADDAAVRANRLALLRRVDQLISHSVADLTQVVLESTSTSRMPSTTEAIPS